MTPSDDSPPSDVARPASAYTQPLYAGPPGYYYPGHNPAASHHQQQPPALPRDEPPLPAPPRVQPPLPAPAVETPSHYSGPWDTEKGDGGRSALGYLVDWLTMENNMLQYAKGGMSLDACHQVQKFLLSKGCKSRSDGGVKTKIQSIISQVNGLADKHINATGQGVGNDDLDFYDLVKGVSEYFCPFCDAMGRKASAKFICLYDSAASTSTNQRLGIESLTKQASRALDCINSAPSRPAAAVAAAQSAKSKKTRPSGGALALLTSVAQIVTGNLGNSLSASAAAQLAIRREELQARKDRDLAKKVEREREKAEKKQKAEEKAEEKAAYKASRLALATQLVALAQAKEARRLQRETRRARVREEAQADKLARKKDKNRVALPKEAREKDQNRVALQNEEMSLIQDWVSLGMTLEDAIKKVESGRGVYIRKDE